MSWSEIKKKKEEEEKKRASKKSNSDVSRVANNLTGSLWKNIGQNIITSERNAEIRKQKEQQEQKKTSSVQSMPTTYKRTLEPTVTRTMSQGNNASFVKQSDLKNQKLETVQENTTWGNIVNFVKNTGRTLENIKTGAYTNLIGLSQTAIRDISDVDKAYSEGKSAIRNTLLPLLGDKGNQVNNYLNEQEEKNYAKRNEALNSGLQVLSKEKQKANEDIQRNVLGAKLTDSSVATKMAEIAPSIGQQIPGFAFNAISPVASLLYFKGSAEANYYDDAISRGMEEKQAKIYSKLMSYVEAGTEQLSVGNISKGGKTITTALKGAKEEGLKKGLKAGFDVFKETAKEETANTLKSAFKDYGIGVAEEAFQEAITEPIQEFTAMKVAGEDKADWNNMWQRMLQSGFDGALSSAILAGANLGISSCQGIVTKIENGQDFTTEEYNTAIKDASQKIDIEKLTTDQIKEKVNQLKGELQQPQVRVNENVDQEIKTSQNGFSQAEKTEALRQEARNKLESIKQNYDENSYNQMQEFIETAPSEKALNQVINDLNKESEQTPTKTENKSFEDVAFEAMNNYESNEVESPLKNRDMDSIGKQTKVNAYQYDNPKVKPYFQEMAQQMGEDLAYIASPENRSTKKGGGTKLSTSTKAMDILHNEQGYSYDQIAKGLQNIIDDKGSENNAISKKIELVIDEQLRNGYNNAFGKYVEPNQEYINTIQQNQKYSVEQPQIQEQTPAQKVVIDEADNLITSAEKYNLDFKNISIQNSQKALEKRGIKARFDESYFNSADEGGKYILTTDDDGKVISREIVLNPKANEHTILQEMAIHELTHDLIASKTQESKDLYNSVLDYLKKDADFETKRNELAESYLQIKDQDENYVYSREQKGFDNMIDEEAVAKALQTKFGTQEEVNRLVNTNRNIAQRIYDWIADKIDTFKNRNNAEYLFWKDVRNKFEKAFAQKGNYDNNSSTVRHYIETVAKFDEMEYNNVIPEELGEKEYQILRHIINTDSNIKPGINYVEVTNGKYTVYYKGFDNFKVMSKETDADAGRINERNGRTGGKTRYSRSFKQDFKDQRTTTSNDEISNIYTKGTRQRSRSDTSSSADIKNVKDSKESSFNLPEKELESVDIETFSTDSYEGQTNLVKQITDKDGNVIAKLEYAYYDGQNHVQMIEVEPEYRRKGLAKKLLQDLQAETPDKQIMFGMTTPDGTKLIESVTEKIKNPVYNEKKAKRINKLEQQARDLRQQIEDYNNKLKSYAEKNKNGTITEEEMQEWRKLSHEQTELMQEEQDVNEKWYKLEQKTNANELREFNTFVKQDNKVPAQDNQGRQLSKQQQKYFKDSKAINENGELETVYHGTNKAGFTEFNRSFNYYTNNKAMAQSYTGGTEMVDTKRLESVSDAKSWLKGITDELYIENNSVYDYDGEKILSYDNSEDLMKNLKRDIQNEIGDINAGGTYEGYVNITKPIEIDANNETWSMIDINNISIKGIDNIEQFLKERGSSVWREKGKLRTSTADIVSAIYDAVEDGEIDADGVIIKNIYDEGGYGNITPTESGTDYITFNSNQFKARDNLTPTTNKDIRYSVSTDGAMKDNKTGKKVVLNAESNNDGKSLLAIHNLTEDKLKGVLELGGFAVPSIAVTNQPHTNFGDISVIFNKNTVDPSLDKANKIYSRDAYTARTPNVVNKIIESGLKEVSKNTGIEEWNLRENYKEISIEDAVEKLRRNENIIDKYLKEKGIEIEPVYRDFKGFTHLKQDSLQDFINQHKELVDLSYTDKYSTDTYKKYYNDVHNLFVEDIMKEAKIPREKAESFYKDYPGFNHWDYFIRDLNAVQELKGKQQLDEYATKEAKEKAVDVESKEYKDYVKKLISPMYGEKYIRNNKDYYTASGTPRSFNQRYEEYTLDNIVKIMNENKGTGQESTWGVGINEIAGDASKRFKNIKDIKNNENLLMTQNEEEHKQILDKYNTEFRDIENSILDKYSESSIDGYVWREKSIEDAMKNIARKMASNKKITEQNVISQFDTNGIKINENQAQRVISLIKNLSNLPTNYFEAKPQRAVGFDEIDVIVIPKDVSKEVKQQLKDRGIKTIEYDRNNENERADILKSLNEYKFSKTNESFDEYLTRRIGKEGTRTPLKDLRLPMKEKQEVKAPLKQGNVQQNQNNNSPGENINWNEIERPENNQKFRKHYRSIIESSNTTAEAKAVAKELMGTDTYEPETNKGQLAQADQRIMTSSPEVELQALRSRVLNGERITSVDIAVGERLIQYFSKTGSAEQLQDAIQTTALAGTSTGQTLQALTILNHQTPQGQVTWLQRSIDKMNKELAKKKGGTITTDADGNIQIVNKQGKDITNKVDLFNLTPEMMNKIMQSENQEQMLQNIDEVYEELGQQVPKSMLEKVDSWRYFSMLANMRTHGRNMIGNFAMGKMQRVKDKIAGGIEDVVSKFNPEMERTKTLRRADKKTKEFAKNDFKNVEVQSRLELNESKFNPQSRLQNARRTFKSDTMENTLGRLFNLNDKLLEAEDGIGLKAGYQKALADYITANKIDIDNITDSQLNKARNYAVQQAKEATFHQANAIASAVAQFENKNLATKLFTGAVLPFKKTPMNVAKAGMEYSPLQIAKSATVDLVNLRKGNISVNQYIDNLSKGITGTGIALVGYALANAGILKASGGDDKDKEKYEEEQGKQSYSIQIAGKTYSLDWLAPTGIPLFIGAETHKLFNQEETEKSTEKKSEEDRLNQAIKGASNLLNAGATAINPMSEMSMISGLTSALSSYNTSDNLGSLGNIMTNAGKSYINQFVPTALGQLAKTTDKYERTTKSTATGTIGKAVDQTINQIKNKIPGLRQTLPIKTDIWGNDVKQEVNLPLRAVNNFINPATVKNVSTDKVDMELNKLYEENHSSSLLPDILTKTVQLNKQTYRLSNKEYAEFTKNYGQTSHKLIENFIKTSDYNKLTQEQKETAISNIYSYAKEQNKMDYAKKVNETVKPSTLYTTMKEIEKNGGKQSEYLSYLAKTKGMSKESEKNKVLADSNYSNRTKEIIYTNGTGKDDNLYNNLLSKSHINMTEYLDYKDKVSNKVFSADKDKNGKTVTGSAKAKVINYLNNNITGVGNRLLIAGKSYALQNNEKQKLAQYINSIANTREERIEIYKQLDKNFYVRNGKVYMRVSK